MGLETTLHKTRKTTRISNRGGRNSNVEALRILAMFLILINHFPWNLENIVGHGSYLERLPLDLVVTSATNFGGVGDCLFFFISIWYLCEESPSLKRSCKRTWILERELLFWSLTLFAVFLTTTALHTTEPVSAKTFLKYAAQAFFPTATNHWWFPTSYILFLLICPALCEGLRRIGRDVHYSLAIISTVLFGLVPFGCINNHFHSWNMTYSVWLFVYQFVLVSYLRWYKKDWLDNTRMMTASAWIGLALGVFSQIAIVSAALMFKESANPHDFWMNCPAALPSMMVAIGLIALAQRKAPRHSRMVNKIASSVFTVYLILTDGFANSVIDDFIKGLDMTGWMLLLISFLLACGFFVLAVLLGFIRQGLFAVTVDRSRGHWFELVWDKAMERIERGEHKRSNAKA